MKITNQQSQNKILGFFNEYRFLSNFHICPLGVEYEDVIYQTSEHAYQSAKTLDLNIREEIRSLSHPRDTRKFGQKIILRENWEDMKFGIMSKIVFDKFFRNKDLGQKLLDTKDAYLEESNWWHDNFYGVCTGERCKYAPHERIGENNLGKILMSVRRNLCS